MFVGDDGEQQTVLRQAVSGIARLGQRVVVLVGRAHLMANSGWVITVRRDAHGQWSSVPWLALPGAPFGSATQPDGRLLVHTSGGSVLIAVDGTMELVRCEEKQRAASR